MIMNRMMLKNEYVSQDGVSIYSTFVDREWDKTEVSVKWDGCCDIWLHSNGSTTTNPIDSNVDYFHVCNLKEFIDMLTEVYNAAMDKGYEV